MGTVFLITSSNLQFNALYHTGATKSCMSLKTCESLKLKLTDDKCPFVVTATGTSMKPAGFTQCSFNINGHSFTQKFIVCSNQKTHHLRERLRIPKLYWCCMDKTRLQENGRR